jgi:AcrR family transcriptional regulator
VADSTRPYHSQLREGQARETRRRIVEAGHDLFVEQGYAATTIDAIAARADVSRKTVFTSVGGKVALLKLAFDWSLAGDDEPVPLGERPEVIALYSERDPAVFLASWCRMQCAIALRVAPLYRVLTIAADGDPEAAALLEEEEQAKASGARHCVKRLEEIGGLRDELTIEQATAIAEIVMDPLPARRLVLERGWSFDAYRDFLERTARATLLRGS